MFDMAANIFWETVTQPKYIIAYIVVIVLIMIAVGKLKPRESDFELEDVGAVDLTPWEYRHHLWTGCILQPRADYDVPLPGHRRLSEAFRSNYAVIHRNIQRRPVVSEGKELSQTKMKSV